MISFNDFFSSVSLRCHLFMVLSWIVSKTDTEEKKLLNEVVIFGFFLHKK